MDVDSTKGNLHLANSGADCRRCLPKISLTHLISSVDDRICDHRHLPSQPIGSSTSLDFDE